MSTQNFLRMFNPPSPGDFWIVTGAPASGKSTLLAELAMFCAANLREEERVLHWGFEMPWSAYKTLLLSRAPKGSENLLERFDHSYSAVMLGLVADSYQVLVIDSLDLFGSDMGEVCKALRMFAVRRNILVLASAHLPRSCWRRSAPVWGPPAIESACGVYCPKPAGCVYEPEELPEGFLQHGTTLLAVATAFRDLAVATTRTIQVCKSPLGLWSPSSPASYWQSSMGFSG